MLDCFLDPGEGGGGGGGGGGVVVERPLLFLRRVGARG